MGSSYILRIKSDKTAAEINTAISLLPNNTNPYWEFVIDEHSENFIIAIDYLLDLIEDKRFALESIGINKDDLTIWYYYEYEEQCNMAFEPPQLKRLGDNGIALCISCWKNDSAIHL